MKLQQWGLESALLPSSTSPGPNTAQFTLTHFSERTGAISDCFQTRPQPGLFGSSRSHFLCLLAASWGKAGRGGIAEEQTQGLGKFRHSPGLQGQDGFVFLQSQELQTEPRLHGMAKNKQTGSLAGTDRFLAGSSERQDRATLNEIAPSPERWEMSSAEEKPQISQSVETQLRFALPESNLVGNDG